MDHIHIKMLGYNITFKTMWLLLSLIELYMICKYIPNKKIKVISNIGANTLNIYLLHSLLVKWLKIYAKNSFVYTEITNITIMLLLTCAILIILGNKFVKDKIIYLIDFNKIKEKIKKVIQKEERMQKNMDNKEYIGKIVEVKIDRELGSKHPKHGFIYPVNYGYVPNTVSGDGEEIDCYVLGVFEPIKEFKGKCIAIIHRTNDDDDKLVIVPERVEYTDDAIEALVEFQESYFEHVIKR